MLVATPSKTRVFAISHFLNVPKCSFHFALSQCHFEIGDAEKIPFQDKSFDLVLSYGSLSYLKMNVAFSEISRVLRDQGVLIVVGGHARLPLPYIDGRETRETGHLA